MDQQRGTRAGQHSQMHQEQMMSWGRFAATIGVSIAAMFPLMYQLVYSSDHVTFSINRLVAAIVMGAVMTVVMLGFMWRMFRGTTKLVVLAGSAVAAVTLLALNRSQALVDDVSFMKSMIPHHSIAINNARKAHISDPRVRRLADEIITSQVREIAEMKILVRDIQANGKRGRTVLPAVAAQLTPDMQPKIQEAVR